MFVDKNSCATNTSKCCHLPSRDCKTNGF